MTKISIREWIIILFSLLSLPNNSVYSLDRYRAYPLSYVQSTPKFPILCPLGKSDLDDIQLFRLNNDESANMSTVRLKNSNPNYPDLFLIDTLNLKDNAQFKCVGNGSDGSLDSVMIYIDKDNKFPDIRKIKYTDNSTSILNKDLGDPITLSCSGVGDTDVIWFGPDMLQFNHSSSSLTFDKLRTADFGEYYCGNKSTLSKNGVLMANKFVIKPLSVKYEVDAEMSVRLMTRKMPTYDLGNSVLYSPPSAHSLKRRVIWENPSKTIWLDQGRVFYNEAMQTSMTESDFYTRISDRTQPRYQINEAILFQTNLLSRKGFTMTITPVQATVNEDDTVKIFCNNSDLLPITWSFIPKDGAIGTNNNKLPPGLEHSGSVLYIPAAQFYHSGTYLCNAKKEIKKSVLEVKMKPKLQVTPSKIIIRPGGRATFLCQLIGKSGKVIWKRKNLKSFQVGVETLIGGDTQSLLTVSNAPKSLNGSVYQCSYNEISAEVILLVMPLCPPGEKLCKNDKCIRQDDFCNGVNDCGDNSDEDVEACAQCEPNQKACQEVDGIKPTRRCILAHWFCDGEEDCGNGFDESQCKTIDKETCLSTHFACKNNQTLIPRVRWCDGEPDCPQQDDEKECRNPVIVDPSKEKRFVVQSNTSISLVCEVVSVPTATITWRYNWGRLPRQLNFSITQTGVDCNRIRNILTVNNMDPEYAGVYTCEAISRKRAMGPDYTIFVTSQKLCKNPMFNNAAWTKDMCLRCWCSNVTNQCESARGYFLSPSPRIYQPSSAYLMNHKTMKILEKDTLRNVYNKNTNAYKFDKTNYGRVKSPDLFIASDFGLAGSWLPSYGSYLTVKMNVYGDQYNEITGPIIVIQGKGRKNKLFWCTTENGQVVFANGYNNKLAVTLWEKENWYMDSQCKVRATRENFMEVLKNVVRILIRIKYYTMQNEFQIRNITLDYAKPIQQSDVWVPRVEQCKCPQNYSGLSCEKCTSGFVRTKQNKCVRQCPQKCNKCDDEGKCTECSGYRAGAKCFECKPGYVRLEAASLESDCVKCPCQDRAGSKLVNNMCVGTMKDLGDISCKCNGTEVNDPDCDRCSQKNLPIEIEVKCKNKTKSENEKCSKYGTNSIEKKKCLCKVGYKGSNCETCESGYFQHNSRCLRCFCSNKTEVCSVSNEFRFTKATLRSTGDVVIQPQLMVRKLTAIENVDMPEKYMTVNRSKNFIRITDNPIGSGVVYVALNLMKNGKDMDKTDYAMLYGGRLSIDFRYFVKNLKKYVSADVTPFIEVQSRKIGRMWAPMKLNPKNSRMEVEFSEYFYPEWVFDNKQFNKKPLPRQTIVRALMTASYIIIGFPLQSNVDNQVLMKSIELDVAIKKDSGGLVAPVEVCTCPAGSGKGLRCEKCLDSNLGTIVAVNPGLPDFTCTRPTRDTCQPGSYKYDFILNKKYDKCQKGIEITTKGRVIYVNLGEKINIPCLIKSYRGGVSVHKWEKVSGNASDFTTKRIMTADGNSQSNLIINSAEESHSGVYRCRGRNVLTNTSEEFHIIVKKDEPRLKLDITVTTTNPDKPQFKINITTPDKIPDYKVIWKVVDDGGNTEKKQCNVSVTKKKDGIIQVDISVPTNLTKGTQLYGVVTGERVTNPFYYEIRENIKRNVSLGQIRPKISVSTSILKLKFLESGRISVTVEPQVRPRTYWRKELSNGTPVTLPEGITVTGNTDLVVWSAGSNHNGNYIGFVVDEESGKPLGTIRVKIEVEGMTPPVNKELGEDKDGKVKETSVDVYTPSDKYCPNQKWFLIDSTNNNTIIEITNYTTKLPNNVVRIKHPITQGQTIRFQCVAIKEVKTKGTIEINLDTKYPVLQIQQTYKNGSIFPDTVTAIDTNKAYESNITWLFKGKPLDKDLLSEDGKTINFTSVGGFKPQNHEGLYEVRAENPHQSVTRTILVPDENNPNINNTKLPGVIVITSPTHTINVVDDKLILPTTTDRKIEIHAVLVGNPNTDSKIEWTMNNQPIAPKEQGKYFSVIVIDMAPKPDQPDTTRVYTVKTQLSSGKIINSSITIDVDESVKYFVKIDGMGDQKDQLSVLEGDSKSLRGRLVDSNGNTEPNADIQWQFINKYGQPVDVANINGITTSPTTKNLDINLATSNMNTYKVHCVAKYQGKTYYSPQFTFDVNKRGLQPKLRLIGVGNDMYVTGNEGDTKQVICQAYDSITNKILPNTKYNWVIKLKDKKTTNWKKANMQNEKIVFGGLMYQPPEKTAKIICQADYFGVLLSSSPFTFSVKKIDETMMTPKIKIDVKYKKESAPYPVRIEVTDLSANRNNSVATLVVANKNFPKNIVQTGPGKLVVDFSANGSKFNPYYHSGSYNFTMTNKNGYAWMLIPIPQYKNPYDNYTAKLELYNTDNEKIETESVRIKSGEPYKLKGVFVGHPYPSSLKWSFNGYETSTDVIETHDYWIALHIAKFDIEKHSRIYTCIATTHQGLLEKRVKLIGYDYGIKIDIIEHGKGKVKGPTQYKQGDNIIWTYKATDLYNNKSYTGAKGVWEVQLTPDGNFTQLTPDMKISSSFKEDGNTINMTDLTLPDKVTLRLRINNGTDDIISQPISVTVNKNKDLLPMVVQKTIIGNNSYPIVISVYDRNPKVKAMVYITKVSGNNGSRALYSGVPGRVKVSWEKYPFNPYYDGGKYVITAKNRYGTVKKEINLPEFNKTDRKIKNYVKFEYRVNNVTKMNNNRKVEVVENQPLLVMCNFYGNIPPIMDVEIIQLSNTGASKSMASFATASDASKLYAFFSVDKYNLTEHDGKYICQTRNKNITFKDYLTVKGVTPGVAVTVINLDQPDELNLLIGSDKKIECVAKDKITKKPKKNAKYSWNFTTEDGEVKDARSLSSSPDQNSGVLSLNTVSENKIVKGRCVVDVDGKKYYSKEFKVVTMEDKSKVPRLKYYTKSFDPSFPKEITFVDEQTEKSNLNVTFNEGDIPKGVKVTRKHNSVSLEFEYPLKNPLAYSGLYLCTATNKFGTQKIGLSIKYNPPKKPLTVEIKSDSVAILQTESGIRQFDIALGSRMELDCVYSGEKEPLTAVWKVNDDSTVIGKDEEKMGYQVYRKRSDCLTIVREQYTNKTTHVLICQVTDSTNKMVMANVTANAVPVGISIVIKGLNDPSTLDVKQGSSKNLSFVVKDLQTGNDLSDQYKIEWEFTTSNGTKINLEDNTLAKNTVVGKQNLSFIEFKDLNNTAIFGKIRLFNGTYNFTSGQFKMSVTEDKYKKPNLLFTTEYTSGKPNFPSSMSCTDNRDQSSKITITKSDGSKISEDMNIIKKPGKVTLQFPKEEGKLPKLEGSYVCKGTNKYGTDKKVVTLDYKSPMSVILNSTVNKIATSKAGNRTTNVRTNRELLLDCYTTGEPKPEVKMYLITEPYLSDLPVAGSKILLKFSNKSSTNTYQVTKISKNHIQMRRRYFSESRPVTFQCEATLFGVTKISRIKVYETPEVYKANIISDNNNPLQSKAYIELPFKLGCKVEEKSGKPVAVKRINWTFTDLSGNKLKSNSLADVVTEKSNFINFVNLTTKYGKYVRGKCVGVINETYDVISEEFSIIIEESPRIQSIFVKQTEPEQMLRTDMPFNYTYNATDNLSFTCLVNMTGESVEKKIVWTKDDEVMFQSRTLAFFPDTSTYKDEGKYECVVSFIFKNKMVKESFELNLERRSAPKKQRDSTMKLRKSNSLNIYCDDKYASPPGSVSWRFTPLNSQKMSDVPKKAKFRKGDRKFALNIQKPLKSEYFGTYHCIIKNQYGTGGKSYSVVEG